MMITCKIAVRVNGFPRSHSLFLVQCLSFRRFENLVNSLIPQRNDHAIAKKRQSEKVHYEIYRRHLDFHASSSKQEQSLICGNVNVGRCV